MSNENKWGVYYIPNRNGRIFANLKPELVSHPMNNKDAHEFCKNVEMSGYIDELHIGYQVKLIK